MSKAKVYQCGKCKQILRTWNVNKIRCYKCGETKRILRKG